MTALRIKGDALVLMLFGIFEVVSCMRLFTSVSLSKEGPQLASALLGTKPWPIELNCVLALREAATLASLGIALLACICFCGIGTARADAPVFNSWNLATCTREAQAQLADLRQAMSSTEEGRNTIQNVWLPLVQGDMKGMGDECRGVAAFDDERNIAKKEQCLRVYIKLEGLRSELSEADAKIKEIKHQIEVNPCRVS